MKFLFKILAFILFKTLTSAETNSTTVSNGLSDQTLRTTLTKIFNTFPNDTIALESGTTNWFSDGQRIATERPTTSYVTERRTLTLRPNPVSKYSVDEQTSEEKVGQTIETSSYGSDESYSDFTSSSMGAVYGEEISQKAEDGSDQNGRSGITSKPSTTQYPVKSQFNGSKRKAVEICDFCLYEGQGNFTSYGYPLNYRNNLNCTYRILRIDDSDVCEVELIFHDFDVPISSLPSTAFQSAKTNLRENDCHEDYLEVNGRRYCGPGWREQSEIISFPSNQKELVFRFVSNERTSGRGFWAEVIRRKGTCVVTRVTPTPPPVCEERFSEIEFQFQSPGFPDNYPMNANCAYYIRKANNDVCGLELTFFKFDIEFMEGCPFDYLEIDGQKFCGTLPENSQNLFNFESDQKLIIFQSDPQVSKSGFRIHAKQITDCYVPSLPAPPSCNVCTSEGFGAIVSYGYPDHYRNNLFCTYTIERRNPDYCNVELDFEDFELQNSINCEDDYLQLEGQRFCGKTLKSTKRIVTFDNRDKGVVLVFKTDHSKTKRGFLIQYKQLECTIDLHLDKTSSVSAVVPAEPRQCDYVFTEKEFVIRSENFSKSYANNMDCSYYVKRYSNRVCYLELTFLKFDVEASPECQYDYLEVGDTVRLCGTLQAETVRTYIFDGTEKLIKFHSDASTNRSGYLIKAEQLECEGDKIIRKPSFSMTTLPTSIPPTTRQSTEQVFCSQAFEDQELNIISPNYPNFYAPNLDCLYMIRKISPNICKLDVSFDDFEIQPSDPNAYCKYDFVDFNGIRVCGEVVRGDKRSYSFQKDTFPIHFHSDNSVTSSDRGFRINIRQTECQISSIDVDKSKQEFHLQDNRTRDCNKIFTETVFELKSPNYPESYPNNANCRYIIIKKTDDIKICQLEVNFIDMNLEKTNDCQHDYLNFNGQLMCGSLGGETTKYYLFDANEFVINFVSDSFRNDRGFFLRIRQKECPPHDQIQPTRRPFGNGLEECSGVYRETSFELKSPHYPEYYENNLNCVFTIMRKNENICRIELRFIDFDIEPSPDCSYDYLMVDGKKLCGHMKANLMKTIEFYEPEKVLTFRSGTSSNRRGFLIKGQQKECDTYSTITQSSIRSTHYTSFSPIPSICELCFTEVMGTIQSYDYPNPYPPNLNCKYRITALPSNCMVQLNFEEFSLEMSQNCESDYLEINNVKYCGKQLEGTTLMAFNKYPNGVLIRFVTNNQISGRGFRASYTQLPCIGGVPAGHPKPTPTSNGVSGFGSHPIAIIDETKIGFDSKSTRIPCDLVIYDMMFEIKSPNYPKHYPENIDCLFSIRKANPSICKLKLNFEYFDVEGNDKHCSGDSLEIDGNKICGRLPNNTIKEFAFTSHKTSLRFRSYSDSRANGFKISGEQVDCPSRVSISEPSSDQTKHSSSHSPTQYGLTYPQTMQSHYPTTPHFSPTSYDPSRDQSKHYYNSEISHQTLPQPQQPDNYHHSTHKSLPPESSPSQVSSHSDFDPYNQRLSPTSSPIIPINSLTPSQHSANYQWNNNYQQIDGQHQSNKLILPPPEFSESPRSQSSYQLNAPQVVRPQPPDNQHTFQQNPRGQTPYTGFKHQILTKYGSHEQIDKCDETIHSMYFEIKSPKAPNSQCMYTIQKVNDNICQMDMMFTAFDMGDPMCQHEYLIIGQEKLCGDMPKNTIKTYKFNEPNMFLHMKSETMRYGKGFNIKGRQVECTPSQMNNQQMFGQHLNANHSHSHGMRTNYNLVIAKTPQPQKIGSKEVRIGERPQDFHQTGQQDRGHIRPNNLNLGSNFEGYETRKSDPLVKSSYDLEVPTNRRCTLIYSETDFTIMSPNHPNSYPSHMNCRYTIRKASPNICAIDMKFDSFEIEDDPKCAKDYLEVDAGRICGVLPPSHERRYYFLPEEYEKVLKFKSDSSGSKSGFSLHVRQIADCTKPWKPRSAPTPTVCDVCLHSLRGQITSSNYPNKYSDYMRCSYRIQAMGPQYCQVRIYLRDIDIESSPSGACDKDALIIDSERLCGKDLNRKDMVLTFPSSEPREVQLNFQSDANGSGRGFHIEYIQEACPASRLSLIAQPNIPIDSNLNNFPPDSIQPMETKVVHRIESLIPPIYPPNYVSRAHIEEIVQTQVQVLDKRDNQTNIQNNNHTIAVQ